MLTNNLNEREAYCERLQVEVVSLRHDLEKKNKYFYQYRKLEESIKDLDEAC